MSASLRTYLLAQTAILLDAVDGIGASGKPRGLFETRRAAQQVCLGAFTGLLPSTRYSSGICPRAPVTGLCHIEEDL